MIVDDEADVTITFKAGIEDSNKNDVVSKRIEVHTCNDPVAALSEFKPNCLDSGKYVSLVQNHLAFGTSLRVPETPAFIIEKSDGSNLDYLPGAYPFPAFQALIDKKLTGG